MSILEDGHASTLTNSDSVDPSILHFAVRTPSLVILSHVGAILKDMRMNIVALVGEGQIQKKRNSQVGR